MIGKVLGFVVQAIIGQDVTPPLPIVSDHTALLGVDKPVAAG
jgi:hypothetical protein